MPFIQDGSSTLTERNYQTPPHSRADGQRCALAKMLVASLIWKGSRRERLGSPDTNLSSSQCCWVCPAPASASRPLWCRRLRLEISVPFAANSPPSSAHESNSSDLIEVRQLFFLSVLLGWGTTRRAQDRRHWHRLRVESTSQGYIDLYPPNDPFKGLLAASRHFLHPA